MPRLRRFTHSLISGYAVLGANMVLTILSIPLALHYMTREEFGLWALLQQLMGYAALIDMGLGGSVCRLLIDHKDTPEDGKYGALITTDLLVSILQSLFVLATGLALAAPLAAWMDIPAPLTESFVTLLKWCIAVLAGSFITRVSNHILFAHQRIDIANVIQIVAIAANTAVLWVGLSRGWGLYALLASQAANWGVNAIGSAVACIRLKLLPRAGQWSRPTREQFSSTFHYSKNVFLQIISAQLILASQTIIITHQIGLEAAAAWAVFTKPMNLLQLLIARLMGYSAPAFSEMITRGEKIRLSKRFSEIALLMVSLGIVCGIGIAVSNAAFVSLWTADKFSWPWINHSLLGLCLLAQVVATVYTGFVPLTKDFGLLGWMGLLEGVVFVGLATWLSKSTGVTGILLVSFLTTAGITLPYSLQKTARYLGVSRRDLVFKWGVAALKIGIPVSMAATLALLATLHMNAGLQFVTTVCVCLVVGAPLFVRHGLPVSVTQSLPGSIRHLLARFQTDITP